MTAKLFDLTARLDTDLILSATPTQRVLHIHLRAPQAQARQQRTPLNLALVIDRSGSMSGEKLSYVRQAALHVIDLLDERDRAALVAYDDQVSLLCPSVEVTSANKTMLRNQVQEIRSGGMTNLSGGWLEGCQQIAAQLNGGQSVARCLLLTDGLANVGITHDEELQFHARQLHQRGVATSTFGVGQGFNEHLLEGMSNQGGGQFYFIEHPRDIPQIFAREMGDLTTITARGLEITISLPEQTSAEVLGGWQHDQQAARLTIRLGDLPATAERDVFVRLLTPPQAAGSERLALGVGAAAQGEDQADLTAAQTLELRYAPAEAVRAAALDETVMKAYARVEVADRATQALRLERMGRRDEASASLNVALQMAAPFFEEKDLEEYRRLSEKMKGGLDEAERKLNHYSNYRRKQSRGE
ncbi:MAG: VWA domain-containing protein [Chloroflexi bacterium]|nr:VWA domain-containing protein [Chloroflexota bacterium]